MRKLLLPVFLLAACVSSAPAKAPNDHEWSLIDADYQWLQTMRTAQPAPAPNASRKQQIETLMANHAKLLPTYTAFIDKLDEYYQRTADPRAAAMYAREKIALGDEYMTVLSRYDRALELYREALRYEPTNADAARKAAEAERHRFVSMDSFAIVKQGMKEDEVQTLVGMPREDWIKQVVQNSRVYSVWIYPKSDGGASAIYFDNGVVYHTNWNAAAPQPQQAK
jgi:tetratricopeptide (TPR) repeat protein